MTRHVIVGMGVTGISAASTLRELDHSAEIILVSDDPFGYYSRPGLAYYLCNEIPEKQLFPFDKQDWKNLNVRQVKARAILINPGSHFVAFSDSPPIGYDRLLLATGATSMSLNVPGENLAGVVKLDDLEDAQRIISTIRHSKTAVVVGGGVVSVEMVEGLLARGVKVHYFLRGDRYWTNVLDEQESRLIEKRLENEGVTIHYRTEIAEILGRKGRVTGVRTKKDEIIPCGIIGTCIGVRPRLELALSGSLATEKGILANELLQTSDPDIFAAGDAAQVLDPQAQHSMVSSLWAPGRSQGLIAARNMAGGRQVYQRKGDLNILRLAGVMISIIGSIGSGRDEDLVSVARGSSETWLQMPNSIALESGDEINHLRLMVGERTLQGAIILGDQKLSIPLQEMVEEKIDITPIRDLLLKPSEALGQIIMNFWSSTRKNG